MCVKANINFKVQTLSCLWTSFCAFPHFQFTASREFAHHGVYVIQVKRAENQRKQVSR